MKAKTSTKSLPDLNAEFLRAAGKGNLKAVRKWIASGNPVVWRGPGNSTALIAAAENGHSAVVQLLIDAGAELNEPTTGNWTALALASTRGHDAVVKVLLDSGADPNIETKLGDTPLSLAMKDGRKRIITLLELAHARIATSKALGEMALNCVKQYALSVNTKGGFGPPPRPKQRQNAAVEATRLLEGVKKLVRSGAQGGDYAFWQSAKLGYCELLDVLLEAKANRNAAPHLSSALGCAAEHGHLHIVRALLKAGASVNYPRNWQCPILRAAEQGHVEIVAEFIRHGADVNFCARLGATPLLLATTHGKLDLMRVLLEGGADVNRTGTVRVGPPPKPTVEIERLEDSKVFSRTTHYPDAPEALDVPPLVVAARRNLVDTFKLLLEFSPDLEAKDKEGMTALAWARKLGHKEIEKLLTDAGANESTATDGSPLNALIVASAAGNLARVKELIARGADANGHLDSVKERKTPLSEASRFGHAGVVQALIAAGAQVEKPVGERLGSVNQTPLMLAAEAKHVDVVRALLKAGADVNQKDGQVFGGGGLTPLHYAAIGGSREVVQLLLNAGAKASERTKGGDTPLKIASMHGHHGVIDLLLAAGGRVVARKGKASRLLNDAAFSGNLAAVKRLLKQNPKAHGDDLNFAASACFGVKFEILQTLVTAGLPVNGKDAEGDTPLMHAIRAGRTQVVKFLLSKGADPKAVSSERKTPLSIASEFGRRDILRLLKSKHAK